MSTALLRSISINCITLLCTIIPYSISLSITSTTNFCSESSIDSKKLKETINQGRVYQIQDFFTEDEVLDLLTDMDRLESIGSFQRSGLSNTVQGKDQNFGLQDRLTCPVPWWKTHVLSLSVHHMLPTYAIKLRQLQKILSSSLDRPSMIDNENLAHECYYSKSLPNSSLKRHMDERHEEFKQAKGWLLPSRRSISWLVYLSDDPWTLSENGGALRYFPQKHMRGQSTHQGNLQVGWWLTGDQEPSLPVYLNSWFPFRDQENSPLEAHCILYILSGDDGDDNVNTSIQYITKSWSADSLLGMSTADFITANQKELFDDPSKFYLIEERALWDAGMSPSNSDVVDVVPLRRSLVLFDSVSVPHEVLPIRMGTRRALAGWFHEETQAIPQDYYQM
jgi:hypothetical protein